MTIRRAITMWAGALLGLAVLAMIPSAGPELVAEGDIFAWWESAGTAAAAIGVLHLVALVFWSYVSLVLTLVGGAATMRRPRLVHRLAWLAPRSLRRHLAIGVVAGVLATPATVSAQDSMVLTDLGPGSSPAAPIALVDLGSVADADLDRNALDSDAETKPRAHGGEPTPNVPDDDRASVSTRESFREPMVAAVADSWLVEPGDHLWSIATAVVTDATGTTPSTSEIATYWRDLIAANEATIVDPDMIFPGQVLRLPEPLRAGS